MVSHPETGSDSSIGSDRDRERDINTSRKRSLPLGVVGTPPNRCPRVALAASNNFPSCFVENRRSNRSES